MTDLINSPTTDYDDPQPGDKVRIHVDDYQHGFAGDYKDEGRDWMVGHVNSGNIDADGDIQVTLEDPPSAIYNPGRAFFTLEHTELLERGDDDDQ